MSDLLWLISHSSQFRNLSLYGLENGLATSPQEKCLGEVNEQFPESLYDSVILCLYALLSVVLCIVLAESLKAAYE